MRTSILGKTGLQVSALGFGCMRFPQKQGRVDREQTTMLLVHAFELGVNYFDTAVGYCGGESQPVLGQAVKPFRDKIVLTTKNPGNQGNAKAWWQYLEDSLRLLETDYIDLYLHHGIGWDVFTENLDPAKGGLTGELLKAKDQGLVRHVGFSFHDSPESLMKLADTGYYEAVTLQYNLLDQASADAMTYAREKGLGIVVMGPVGGGRLGLPSSTMAELTCGAATTTAEAALRFVWGHPAVNVALSGMSSLEMVDENVRIAKSKGGFSPEQVKALNRLVEERKQKSGLYCTACKYCLPVCAVGMEIPEQLDLLNLVRIYGLQELARNRYQHDIRVKASDCTACGKCVEACPQNIDVPARLREAVLLLDPRAGSVVIRSDVMEIEPSTGSFAVRLQVKSLAEAPTDLSMTVRGADGTRIDPVSFAFGEIPAFGQKKKLVKGTFAPGTEELHFTMDLSYQGRSERIDETYAFQALAKGLSEDFMTGPWHVLSPDPDSFPSAPETVPLHGARFKLTYDDEGLLLLADVRDDFLYPSSEEMDKGKLIDGLELFLDGRPPTRVGRATYEPGVYQVMLYPGTKDGSPAFYQCNTDIAIRVSAERTPAGYRMRVRLPFASFCVRPGAPKKIGFDLAVNTADALGQRIGQYVWAGTPDNWRNASAFREIWLR